MCLQFLRIFLEQWDNTNTNMAKMRTFIVSWCYVGNCPLSEVCLMYTTFRELVLLPNSGHWLSLWQLSYYCYGSINGGVWSWFRDLL